MKDFRARSTRSRRYGTSRDTKQDEKSRQEAPPKVGTEKSAHERMAVATRHQDYIKTMASHRIPSIHAALFNIVQEHVFTDLYKLLLAASLWNRTRGSQAWPVFSSLLEKYPEPQHLAKAVTADLATLLRPLGLQNIRAKRLLSFAKAWLRTPPTKLRRYRRLGYPFRHCGRDIRPSEVLGQDDPREGWEIAHLPGIGPYALDSFRIFHRDILRGVAQDYNGAGASSHFEPEWKRVMPLDKELKEYIFWRWLQEGWIWDPSCGKRTRASVERMNQERNRRESLSPFLL